MEIIWKIDLWLIQGMNSDSERLQGCYHCHGTILKMKDGNLDPDTWPNVGVGRINMNGSNYSWWHGFYECKKRYVGFMKESNALETRSRKSLSRIIRQHRLS
jgi:hypothetical protein